MRHALLALPLLVGCVIDSPSPGDDTYYPPPDNTGWGSGYGGSGGGTSYGCHADADCTTGNVCARDGECMSSTAVRIIHVNWTVRTMPANDTTCAHSPNLAITFGDPAGYSFGFAPVPCRAGRYTIDKFPKSYDRVELSREGEYSGGDDGLFDAMGNVTLDLPY